MTCPESLMLRLGKADWKRAGNSVSPLSYSTKCWSELADLAVEWDEQG